MANDLFHDVARAYYGVSAELYTLANIATHGNAPAGYAMGCDAGEPSQYAQDDPMQKIYNLAARAARAATVAAKGSPDSLLHHHAATLHDLSSEIASAMGNTVLADRHVNRMKSHQNLSGTRASRNDPELSLEEAQGKFRKPELPAPPEQPKSMPGQKTLFANDSQQPPSDADEEKPNFAETGTGDHYAADEEDYGIMDAIGGLFGAGKTPPATPRPPAPPASRAEIQASANKLVKTPQTAPSASRTAVQTSADKVRQRLPQGVAPATVSPPKPRISEDMKMAAQRIQQRHNSQQRVPPSSKPWS